MSLTSKQDEWSNLLSIESIEQPLPPSDMFKRLGEDDRLELSAAWVGDGIHARHTDYPKTTDEIKYFKWSRSALMRGLFNCAVVIQIFSTFLDNTSCDHEYALDTKLFYPTGAPTRLALTIFDLLCLVVYLFELFLAFAVNPKQKSLLSKPWSTFRLLICLFVLLDCLIYFIDPTQPRLMRCVYPFLLISKRNNLKLMLQGLLISAYKSLPIIKALVTILVMWGFAGFYFFRATDADNLAFSSPGSGIAEALHCFTSRPYVLKALDSIYPNDQASALYFVTLTLAADILCIGLIVATGAKHYKQFAGHILHSRLVDRRHAISCAFYALTVDSAGNSVFGGNSGTRGKDASVDTTDTINQIHNSFYTTSTLTTNNTSTDNAHTASALATPTISRQTWLDMCTYITGKYATTTHTANFIFDLVIDSDTRDPSCVSMYTNNISPSGGNDRDSVNVNTSDVTKYTATTIGTTECIDEYLFFRACALIATRIVIQVDESGATTDAANTQTSANVSVDVSVGEDGYELPRRSSAIDPNYRYTTATSTTNTTNSTSTSDPNSTEAADMSINAGNKSVLVNAELEPGADPSTVQVVVSNSTHSSLNKRLSHTTTRTTRAKLTTSTRDRLRAYFLPVRAVCVQITGAQITVGGGKGGEKQYTIGLFYAVRIVLLLLMAIDLCFLSSSSRTLPAFYFACMLECAFWIHLLIRVAAVGLRRFVSFYENRGDTLLNIASLVTIIKFGQEYTTNNYDFHSSLALGWYLLIQCARLFKLFFVVNEVKIFEHMRPVLVRASFIYFSVIYFFSIFAYSYFCNAMNVTDATNTSPSNDASQWVQYSNLLNFNTLLQSLFTLFQLSLLGNWSIVMDAAVASTSNPASTYIFFYAYRLTITLFVLPILLSFLIQVFLSALSVQEKEREMSKLAAAQAFHQQQKQTRQSHTRRDSAGVPIFPDRAVSTTQVSYNVNQEVLVLGRAHRDRDRDREDNESTRNSAYTAHTHSVDSARETMSPLAPISEHSDDNMSTSNHNTTPDSSNPSSRSASPVRSLGSATKQPWRPVSIKLGVNRAAATQARDKHSESIQRASLHQRHTLHRDSEWGSSGSEDQDSHVPSNYTSHNSSHNSSAQSSVDRGTAPPSPRSRPSEREQLAKVTVQYDSKGASSMMSIWTIAGNAPTPKESRSSPRAQSTPQAQSDSSELASLRAQLHAALQALEAEKMKNGAQEEVFL